MSKTHEDICRWKAEFAEWETERAVLSENDGLDGTTPDQWADSDDAATELAQSAAGILLEIGSVLSLTETELEQLRWALGALRTERDCAGTHALERLGGNDGEAAFESL